MNAGLNTDVIFNIHVKINNILNHNQNQINILFSNSKKKKQNPSEQISIAHHNTSSVTIFVQFEKFFTK